MKTYRSPRVVLAEIATLIAKDKPSPGSPSVLVRVAKLLHDTRNYYRVGVYLVVNDRVVRQAVCGPELPKPGNSTDRAEFAAPIKIGTQLLGYVRAESEHTSGDLPPNDRVLLRRVALLLARYLHSTGRHLMRKAREAVREAAAAVVENTPHPTASPAKAEAPKRESFRAAAGEKVSA